MDPLIYDVKKIGNYQYYESPDNEYVYYINMNFPGPSSFFFDKNKKIIFGSRYYFNWNYETFINGINAILESINETDLGNAILIDENVISICKWFVTYGHYMDEAFCLSDFQRLLTDSTNGNNYKLLLDYHIDNNITNYPVYKNYKIIQDILFGDNGFNAYSYGLKILKIKKLFLIKHDITDPMFHSFPIFPRNKILSTIQPLYQTYENVYISRGKATHLNRNLDNEDEIEQYLISNSYIPINPEIMDFYEFIHYIHNASNIVMTWGGAMTNMCYFKDNTNVIVLKSRSYEHENLGLFQKIIDNYKLNVKDITHENNSMAIPFL